MAQRAIQSSVGNVNYILGDGIEFSVAVVITLALTLVNIMKGSQYNIGIL